MKVKILDLPGLMSLKNSLAKSNWDKNVATS